MIEVRLVAVSLVRNMPMGESSPATRWPDSVVAKAKALRSEGWTLEAIAAELGPHHTTVLRWVNGRLRKPPARVIARRVRSESFVADHQQPSVNPAPMRVAGSGASVHAVEKTDSLDLFADPQCLDKAEVLPAFPSENPPAGTRDSCPDSAKPRFAPDPADFSDLV